MYYPDFYNVFAKRKKCRFRIFLNIFFYFLYKRIHCNSRSSCCSLNLYLLRGLTKKKKNTRIQKSNNIKNNEVYKRTKNITNPFSFLK